MRVEKKDYFFELLADSLAEHGLSATADEIKAIAEDVVLAVENMDQAFPVPDFNPHREESARLLNELDKEKRKVHCETCKGRGVITIYGPVHFGTTSCFKCNGEGKHLP